MRRILIVLAVIAALAVAVWGASALSLRRLTIPDEPPVPAAPPPHRETQSELNLQVTVGLPALEALIEANLPRSYDGVLADPTGLLGNSAIHWAVNRGPVTLTALPDGRIGFTAPILKSSATLQGQVNAGTGASGLMGAVQRAIGPPYAQTVDFAGSISGSLAPRVLPDWTIDPALKIEVKFDQAESQLFNTPLRLSFREQAERIVGASATTLVTAANAWLKTDPRLRDAAANAWAQAGGSHAITTRPPVWLRIVPQAIAIAPLTATGRDAGVTFAATVATDVVLAAAVPDVTVPPLPPLSDTAPAPGRFVLKVPVSVRLAELAPLGAGQRIDLGGDRSVTIDNLALDGANGIVGVTADVVLHQGRLFDRVAARVHLSGRPEVDAAAGRLSVTGLRYTVGSRNALVQSGAWALQPLVVRAIERRAVFDLPGGRPALVAAANAQIALMIAQMPGVTAQLKLDDLGASDLAVENGWLTLFGSASGTAALRIDSTADVLRAK
jgi:hypothetical protein